MTSSDKRSRETGSAAWKSSCAETPTKMLASLYLVYGEWCELAGTAYSICRESKVVHYPAIVSMRRR